jgi:hypothetical protein
MAKAAAAPVAPAKNAPAKNNAPDNEAKETKTIVPAKYAGKYKNGGQGPLSDFIREQCGEGDKFDYDVFFNLCKLNGIADDKIAIYKAAVDEKKNGANGRARMTLGNMLRAIARKNQKLVGTDKKEHAVAEPQIAASGAVAAKKAADAAKT